MNVPDSKQNNTSMKSDLITGISVLILLLVLNSCTGNAPGEDRGGGASDTGEPFFRSAEIFAPIELHTHGGTITELPGGSPDTRQLYFLPPLRTDPRAAFRARYCHQV